MRRRGLAIAAWAALALALAAAAAGAGPLQDSKVAVSSTRDPAEERELVPITRKPRANPEVAISMSQAELPGLRNGDLLRVSAEVETTNNCRHPGALCVTRPYHYDPRVGTQLVIARRATATGGPGAVPLTKRRENTCRQREPHREHHCVEVFHRAGVRLGDDLPCKPKQCVINLVVDAHNPDAEAGEHVLLGVDRRGGQVSQGRGRINVTRFRGPPVESRVQRTERRLRSRVGVERRKPSVLYSLKLGHLKPDDQFTFEASATAAVGHLPYDAFVGSQLVLASGPHKTGDSPLANAAAQRPRRINRQTGFNCTALTTPCKLPRVGALRIAKTPMRNGHPVPLYVNYVFRNAPKRANDHPGDVVKIRRGGFIEAQRYPAAARGKG